MSLGDQLNHSGQRAFDGLRVAQREEEADDRRAEVGKRLEGSLPERVPILAVGPLGEMHVPPAWRDVAEQSV